MYYFIAAVQCISDAGGYCAKITQVLESSEKSGALTGLAQVPGLEFLGLGADASLGDILASLYIFGLALVAVSALLVLTAAGVMYITAGDNEERFKEAKKWMGNATFGLFLALISYLILFTINPDLTKVVDIKTLLKQIDPGSSLPPGSTLTPGGEVIPTSSAVACSTNIVGATSDTVIACGPSLSSCTGTCDPSFCVPYTFCGKSLGSSLPSP